MTWSLARARRAAADVRAAPLGREAAATLRPRGISGLTRTRVPLSLLLYLAAQDGLVTEQDNGGFAVLQRPSGDPPIRSGGYRLRLFRWLDRHWDFVWFSGPPALAMIIALLAALSGTTRIFGLLVLVAGVVWLCAFMTGMVAGQLRWVARLGASTARGRERAAESLPFDHWSVRLVHQPEADRIDELIRLLTERLVSLVRADLKTLAKDRARVDRAEVTATLVLLPRGMTTLEARTAIAESLRAMPGHSAEPDVIMLAPATRLQRVPQRPTAGGGFLLLYIAALLIVVPVCAIFVASAEHGACAPTACAGRPATYDSALRYLLQRLLLFSDPSGLSPATTRVVILGWLVSVAAAMLVPVAFVAGHLEIKRNREVNAEYHERMSSITEQARILMLVVTDGERQAVLEAVRERVGRAAVVDQGGERTIYTLGSIANTELFLAQAPEQGTAAAGGMLVTAQEAIARCHPDYVVLTGICYGLAQDKGQRKGDIVVAQRMQNIDHIKVTDDDHRPVIYRGVNVGCSPALLDRFQSGMTTWAGPSVHFGTVLSSNTLVNSERVVCHLRHDFPGAIAGEMEGSGVYAATLLGSKPDWIIVKAISDWGHSKDDEAQPLAARNAAEFVVHVIAGSAFQRRRAGT
jgi:nucleoside phosphorylase